MEEGSGRVASEEVQTGRFTFWLFISAVVTSMCGAFQFGYQIGVLTGPSDLMQDFYNQSNYERRGEYLSDTAVLWLWSTTVSVFCIGGAAGALTTSYLADVLGRKGAIMIANIFSIMGGLLMGLSYLANNYEMVLIGRVVIGYYTGVSITVVPLYLAEISPVNLRGAVGTIQQLSITLGILVAQALGLFAFDYEKGWPILLSLTAVPSVIQLFVMPFCPESPRWLYIIGQREDKCAKVLKKLRDEDDISRELNELKLEAEEEKTIKKFGIWSVLKCENPDWRRPLLISLFLHFGQQFSGINAILYYATEIYEQTGMGPTEVAYSTVGTGAVNVLITIIAPVTVTIGVGSYSKLGVAVVVSDCRPRYRVYKFFGVSPLVISRSRDLLPPSTALGIIWLIWGIYILSMRPLRFTPPEMSCLQVFFVESLGRRPLLLYPFAIMAVCTGLLTMSLALQDKNEGLRWMSLVLVYIYIVSFAVGPGPMPYIIVAELWTQGPRPAAMSISIQLNWYSNFVVGLTFPLLQDSIGEYSFLIFMFFCAITAIFIFFYVPETKGRTFEEIVSEFRGGKKPLTDTEMTGKVNNAYEVTGDS